jgi:predicted metal-dependent hydrolase
MGTRKECVENFIQDGFFDTNLDQMRAQAIKSSSEVKIPGTQISGGAEIRVVRSSRRKKSIGAYREQGAIVISVPARLSNSRVSEVIPEMIEKILNKEAREKLSDEQLHERANTLLARYLPEFTITPAAVSWRVMKERWGSCTTVDRTIRISDRLNGAPDYVIDYLLVHELIHLMIPDHGPGFEQLLARFEAGERASAYLDGYEAGASGGS